MTVLRTLVAVFRFGYCGAEESQREHVREESELHFRDCGSNVDVWWAGGRLLRINYGDSSGMEALSSMLRCLLAALYTRL